MTDTPQTPENIAQTVRDLMQDQHLFQIVPREAIDAAIDGNGPLLITERCGDGSTGTIDHTDTIVNYLTRHYPATRKGVDTMQTLDALIAWAMRFGDADTSALFADRDPAKPSLTALADWHVTGPAQGGRQATDATARACAHRAVYPFPVDKAWTYWTALSGKPLTMAELGEVIEDRAADFLDPTPALLGGKSANAEPWEKRMIDLAAKIRGRFAQYTQLLDLSRNFAVYESSDLETVRDPDTGEGILRAKEEHRDAKGERIAIPNLFMIAIPVFERGALYRLPVRLQYRKSGGGVVFALTLHRPDDAFDNAFQEAIDKARDDTGLPLFEGKAPACAK